MAKDLLREYSAKRSFAATPESKAAVARRERPLLSEKVGRKHEAIRHMAQYRRLTGPAPRKP